MRKVHHDRFSHLELEEFGKEWKAFRDKLKVMRHQRKRRAEDLDGFNESNRESVAKCKAKKKMVDKEGFKEKNREDVAKCRENMREKNPVKFKNDEKKRKAQQRCDTTNTYLNEVRLAAIFPCVSCHTLNFRQQVVEFSQKQADSIKEKALSVYQKQKV